jgi:hypothetical protein
MSLLNPGDAIQRAVIGAATKTARYGYKQSYYGRNRSRKVAPTRPDDRASGPRSTASVTAPAGAKGPVGVQNDVAAMQQFLRNRGYNIAVDGVRGPQTDAAVAAFHNHVPPAIYNKSQNNQRAAPTNNIAPAPRGGGGRIPPAPRAKARAVPPRVPGGAPNAALNYLINPRQYAQGAANAEYDPQIAETQRALDQSKRQGITNQQALADWFKQLASFSTQANASYDAASGQALQGLDTANANMAGLFGGSANPAGGEAAAWAGIDRTGLTGVINSEQAFDKQLSQIERMQYGDMSNRQRSSDEQAAMDMLGKLSDLRGAKGASFNKYLGDAQQQRTQQEAAIESLQLAKALAPAQVAGAYQGIQLNAAQNARANAAEGRAQAQAARDAQLSAAQLARTRAEIAAAKKGNDWNLNSDLGQRSDFEKALRTSTQGPRGGFRVGPGTAWKNIQGVLTQEGLQNDPRAQTIAQAIMAETMNNSHAMRTWGEYNFVNGKVVKNGRKYKPKKK